ncbi:MAG TPA: hypothetical protein VFT02_10760, partial [Pyrinomonadaceae bacterium]|nr:hypothetical protein [Pyrinomonadaceae bacterium]
MKTLLALTLALGISYATLSPVYAQDQPATQPNAEELEKEKAEREKNAYRLLDQVIDEAQALRLTENRVRVQIAAADLLWNNNQGRARSLFAMAADGVAEMSRNPMDTKQPRNGPQNQDRRSFQLRQELVLAAARHDAQLAYQMLAATKPPGQTVTTDPRGQRAQVNAEENLEQMLLSRIASLDPKLAAQNAEQMMEKGQFPRTLNEVLNQLQKQDPEAAAKLADKTVKKLQATNLLTNQQAAVLAQSLLVAGPRPAQSSTAPPTSGRAPVLEQSAYVDLLGTVVDTALKAVPSPSQGSPRRPGEPPMRRGVSGAAGIGPGSGVPAQPSDAQIEQNTARRMLAGLQVTLPVIDQYLPAKAAQIRQKLSELGMGTSSPLSVQQTFSALQGNPTSDALVHAAAVAPPQMQPRLYQQAAYKALEEGNTDRARQIATDHLQANARDNVMQRVTFSEMAQKGEGARLDEIRQNIARLQSDEQKIDMLIQLARETEKTNPKLAGQLLEEARQMTNRRAANYGHFEQQLKVARAYATLDPARSFEVLDPAISQINELLSAANV